MDKNKIGTGLVSILLTIGCGEEKPTDYCLTLEGPRACCYNFQVPMCTLSVPRQEGLQYYACKDGAQREGYPTVVYSRVAKGTWEKTYVVDAQGWIIEAEGKPTNWGAGHK